MDKYNILFSFKCFLSLESKVLATGYTKSLLTTYSKCADRDQGWGVSRTRQSEPCGSTQLKQALCGFESKSTHFHLIKSRLWKHFTWERFKKQTREGEYCSVSVRSNHCTQHLLLWSTKERPPTDILAGALLRCILWKTTTFLRGQMD